MIRSLAGAIFSANLSDARGESARAASDTTNSRPPSVPIGCVSPFHEMLARSSAAAAVRARWRAKNAVRTAFRRPRI